MIDKIAALRKIAYGGTPNYDSNPPPRGTFYMNPADMNLSTNPPPVSVQAPSTNPHHSKVQPDAKRSYPPRITGGEMPHWLKRIVDRLPEEGNPFDRPVPNKAPASGLLKGIVDPKPKALGIRIEPGIWEGTDGSVYSDGLYRGVHNYRRM